MENIFQNIKLGSYQEKEVDLSISAFEVFKRLYPYSKNIFLLESLGEEGKYNRFSYVGYEPECAISGLNGELIVYNRLFKSANPFENLKIFSRFSSAGRDFCGGLVGYFSYEAAAFFEPGFPPANRAEKHEFPDFQFGLYFDGLKFDKRGKRCTYFHYGNSRLDQIMKIINKTNGNLGRFSYKTIKNPDEKEHRFKVEHALEEIKKGNIFQVVLSERTDYQIDGDNRRIYAVLRQVNPSPYMIYQKFDMREIISASPELLIRVKGRKIEHFGTLAGTIKRGKDQEEDERLRERLIGDEKELAEHFMLVDLARNDVGKVARFGTITVDKLSTVKKFSKVQHLYSEIRGELQGRRNCFDAIAACFPAGTLTGAPKVEAMKIISKLEEMRRGPYGGVAGYFSFNGEVMLAIIIRSLMICRNYAYTQTGSGIVVDSVPDREFQEIVNKQNGMDETLRRASL